MDRRDFLKRCAAVGAGGLLFSNRSINVQTAARKPNIVFLMADDMGWHDATYNGGDIPTPNIDRLAYGGAILDYFYVQPVCTPTRGCIMTGRYPFKNDTLVRYTATHARGMMLDERTIAEAMKEAGYWTIMLGKWHLGEWESEYLPQARGFDHHYGCYGALIDYYTHYRGEVFDWHRNGRPAKEEGYSTYQIADEFDALMDSYDGKKPFFCYVPFNAIHGPKNVPPDILQKYKDAGHPYPQTAGCVEAMDIAIGRMILTLEKKNLREDTLVFFCSDNGGPGAKGNGPLKGGKSHYHEGGIRVLGLINWPGTIKAGTKISEPFHIVDLYPTFINLAGGSLDQALPIDGVDVWPVLTQGASRSSNEIVHGPETIRVGDWKLIQGHAEYYGWSAGGVTQLYNIPQDPYEETNLADQYPDKVAELEARLAYHATQAREFPERVNIPNFPPLVYGEDEQQYM